MSTWDGERLHTTLDEVRSTLKAVVEEFGEDYRYEAPPEMCGVDDAPCFYVHGDNPGCLVGQVLHRLGVPLDVLSEHEDENAAVVMHHLSLTDVLDPVAAYLSQAQIVQDLGGVWGESLDKAEEFNRYLQEGKSYSEASYLSLKKSVDE